jgi:hypothetical protein
MVWRKKNGPKHTLASISLGHRVRVIKVSASSGELARANEPEARMLTRMNLIGVISAFNCGVNDDEEDEELKFIIIKKQWLELQRMRECGECGECGI